MRAIARLAGAGALALAAAAIPAAPGAPLRVEASGQQPAVVRLVDATTGATLGLDRLPGGPVRESRVSTDNAVVAVRHGASDGGDSLAVYTIAWRVDPASGRPVGQVTQVLDYQPHDGPLGMTLQPVPDGIAVHVQSGRHAPLWRKVFLYRRAAGRWYEWPRSLAPRDPTEGMPGDVGDADTGTPYAARLRPPTAR